MRYLREPYQKTCPACSFKFFGYEPDPCPRCGGFGLELLKAVREAAGKKPEE